jgi:hypothetical protein
MEPSSLVVELAFGDLQSYIKDYFKPLDWDLKLHFSLEIANGLLYLQGIFNTRNEILNLVFLQSLHFHDSCFVLIQFLLFS